MGIKVSVAVLASGSGTNLQALINACKSPEYPARIAVVLSDKPKAYALQRARDAGIPTEVVLRQDFNSRAAFNEALADRLQKYAVEWVALAGFMRIVSKVFLTPFSGKVLNIHPSLLPAFPGLNAQQQAFDSRVQITGATVHLVDTGIDTGPIVAQAAVPVKEEDDVEALKARILRMEHRLYPMVLSWAVKDRLQVCGKHVQIHLDPGESRALWNSEN